MKIKKKDFSGFKNITADVGIKHAGNRRHPSCAIESSLKENETGDCASYIMNY